jgi:hypothetical protein
MKEFSKEFWGSMVQTYYEGFHGKNGVPDSRWEELIDVCGGQSGDDGEGNNMREADLSILDNDRAFVFDFCSPAKCHS